METAIFATLQRLGLSSDKTRELFASQTRDHDDLAVWRDRKSGVIFIDRFYVGDQSYQKGHYREEKAALSGRAHLERQTDCKRRADCYQQFYVGKTICDFGYGEGLFLRHVSQYCKQASGVEVQQDYAEKLAALGINCYADLGECADSSFDTIFCFHVFEHLPDPIKMLQLMKRKLKSGGKLVMEIPHAHDFLLGEAINCQAFKQFTLWSQHLILHNRESLRCFLNDCDFADIVIEGVQRYGLVNHLHWLAHGKPGGHKTALSVMETPILKAHYEAALVKIDATDTLVAVASKVR